MKIKAVISDFDSPISDSYQEGIRRIRKLCAAEEITFGRQERRKLAEFWGLPGKELLQIALGITSELADAMYVEWERMDLADPIPLVSGAKEVLDWAKRNGFISCLLTMRYRASMMDILKRIDLGRRFDIVSCSQDVVYHKPDPRAFWHIQQELKDRFDIALDECIFVGDTANDVRAGKAAGIRPLVVMTGPYLADGAERIDHPDILPSIDALPAWMHSQHTGELSSFI